MILGAGDPEILGGKDDSSRRCSRPAWSSPTLMNELAEERRNEPHRRPHLHAGPRRRRRGHARPRGDRLRSSSSSPWPATTPPAPPPASACTCWPQNPDQRRIWQDDLDGVTATAVDEIVRVASPVTFMRRTVTRDLTLSGHDFDEGDKLDPLLRRRQPRPAGVRRPRALRRPPRPEPPRRLRRPRPALLPRRPPGPPRARGHLPPAPHPPARHRGRPASPCSSRRWASRSSAASSACPCAFTPTARVGAA